MLKKNFSSTFLKQAELLIKVLPLVAKESCFALKGGTAINFFLQEMPRLSVDIDLTYLPLSSREISLSEIKNAILRLDELIKVTLPNVAVDQLNTSEGFSKLWIKNQEAGIKIEVNGIFRGSIFPPVMREITHTTQKLFESHIEMQLESTADIYGGKLCAAFTRQHPRDLFDMKMLMEQNGMTDDIRLAFVVHAAADRRPIHEVFEPNIKRYSEAIFNKDFSGMVRKEISYDVLIESLLNTLQLIKSQLTFEEKQFLITLADGSPDWELLKISHLADLPALQWKLMNIKKMTVDKRLKAVNALKKCLLIG